MSPVFVQSARISVFVLNYLTGEGEGSVLNVGPDLAVLREAPVPLRHREDFLHVPVSVVV